MSFSAECATSARMMSNRSDSDDIVTKLQNAQRCPVPAMIPSTSSRHLTSISIVIKILMLLNFCANVGIAFDIRVTKIVFATALGAHTPVYPLVVFQAAFRAYVRYLVVHG